MVYRTPRNTARLHAPFFADPAHTRVFLALLPPVASALAEAALWRVLNPFAWFLFYPAIVVSAWIGGLAGGVLATLVSTSIVWWYFLPPEQTLLKEPAQFVVAAVFVATGVILSALQSRLQRVRHALGDEAAHARSLLEASLDPLVAIDSNGMIVDVNDATTQVTGVAREKLLGTEFAAYFTRPERAREGWRRVLAEGSVVDFPLTLLDRKSGRLTYVRYNASLYKDTNGRVLGVLAAARDVTPWIRAEGELRRLNRAHRALSSCNQSLIRATDERAWLEEVCRIVVEDAGARFCWVGRAEDDPSKSVRPIALAGAEQGYLSWARITWADEERGRGPTGTAVREQRTVVARDIATDTRLAFWRDEALRRGFASSSAIPLELAPGSRGVLTIYSSEPDAFGSAEVELLRELAGDLAYGLSMLRTRAERNQAQRELETLNRELEARVADRTRELREAREREAETGGRIQQMLLLDEPPRTLRGLRAAALTLPSQRIAGDFYGFFHHEDADCLDVVVADVMGKGVPAALLGAAVKSQFPRALWHLQASLPAGAVPSPAEIVTLVEAGMARKLIGLESFVTAAYARFDVARGRLVLVDCGHTGALRFRPSTGEHELIRGSNLPLGIREGELAEEVEVAIEVFDRVLLYSDGVTEARDASGEFFGPGRLVSCVKANADASPEALVAAVRDAVAAFAGARALADDLTCVVVDVLPREVPVACASLEVASALPELARVRELVRGVCARLDPPLDERRTESLVLAVDEATSNIVKHAHHGRADQRIEVMVEAFPDRVSVRLRHRGVPFDVSTAPLPAFDGSRESGFGVFLMKSSVDGVRTGRDELGRNCTWLEQRRRPVV